MYRTVLHLSILSKVCDLGHSQATFIFFFFLLGEAIKTYFPQKTSHLITLKSRNVVNLNLIKISRQSAATGAKRLLAAYCSRAN